MNREINPLAQKLADLVDRVQARLQEKYEMEEAKREEEQGYEEVDPRDGRVYVSYDGDDIGNAVARAEEENDPEKLKEISNRIDQGQSRLKQWALAQNGEVVEAGGDEGMLLVPEMALDSIENVRQEYLDTVGATLTVGVGRDVRQSIRARMVGKLRGKNMVVEWTPEVNREYEARMLVYEQDEGAKVRGAMGAQESAVEKALREQEREALLDEDDALIPIEGYAQEED